VQKLVLTTSIALFCIKLIAWYITDSVAVYTDALESIVNVFSGAFGLYSLFLAAQPRDENHPYGHGKVEFISAAVEGTLIGVAGILIIIEAVDSLFHPGKIGHLDTGIWLIALSALVNLAVGWFTFKNGKKSNSLALVASGKHLMTDTISTVGIVIGLVIVKISGLIWVDALTAVIFAFIILYTSYKILRASVAGIMDEADQEILQNLVILFNQNRKPGWIDMHNLRVIRYGSVLHLDFHITLPWYLNVDEAHKFIDEIDALVKTEFGDTVEMFVHVDGCKTFSCNICSLENCHQRKADFEKKIEWSVKNVSTNSRHSINS
jgi:cation diffusion facilitator family transporter